MDDQPKDVHILKVPSGFLNNDLARVCKNEEVQKYVQKYLMGIFICTSGGNVLYSFQIDPMIHVDLVSQFIAALSIFGSENVGKIKRILIEGLNVEMNILTKHDLIITIFFRPNMVKDYLNDEAEKALDIFYREFEKPLKQGKTNQSIYMTFDEAMCVLIHDYLIRIDVLKEEDVCQYREKYFPDSLL